MINKPNTLIGPLAYWLLLTLAAVTLFSAPSIAIADPLPGNTYYVAPDGDDNNPGTLESPLQSLEAARQKVRDHKATFGLGVGGIAVILREGTWTRTESFNLTSMDGGEPGRPVVWRAFPGETVRIVGSETLDPAWFRPVTSGDPEWSRIDPVARGNVLKVDLAAHGITDYGTLRVRGFGRVQTGALELFVDEEPMQLARWPKPGQSEGVQSAADDTLTIYGTTTPDVSGTYSKFSTVDGVNSYIKDELVDGVQYYLWRRTWLNHEILTSSWRLVDNHDGNPSLSTNPYWLHYKSTLGTFLTKMNGAIGTPTTKTASIDSGFVTTSTVTAPNSFKVEGQVADRLSRWTTAPEPWFHGFWRYFWADMRDTATSINPATDTITLSEVPLFNIIPGMPFYAYNLLEELTTPGEYYLERSTGILYYWPDGLIANQDLMVSITEVPVVSTHDADYLQFDDISFGMGRSHLVTVDGGTDVTFNRCRFFGAGRDALHLTGTNHSLKRSEIVDSGDGGVKIWGGDRASLTPGNNSVENTEIHNFGRWKWTYTPAIHLYGVGHRVSHNHLHDAPHTAILFDGNDHLIEYNEINDVLKFSDDAGVIYANLNWGYRGNQINYNYIHDIDTSFKGLPVSGIMMDGMASAVSAFGNYFVDISGWAMMHGGGRDGIYENNIAVRCGAAFSASSTGTWFYDDTPGSSRNLLERLYEDGVQYQMEPWLSAYPECAAIPNDNAIIMDDQFTWRYPEGSVFSRNLGWQNGQLIRGQADTFDKFAEIADNLENTDPLFVDEAAGDLRLKSDSPAFTIPGFVDLPFQQMGIVEPPPSDDGTGLTLNTRVVNNNGGTAVPADWTLRATGGPTPFSGPGPSVSSDAEFQAGSYVLSAVTGWSGYTASAWTCDGGSLNGSTITLALGESATCTITNDDLPSPTDVVDFNVHPVESYGGAGQDVNATVAIEDGGSTLRIAGNGWKKIDFPYTITEDTILEFDFQSSTEGEIHGIGFDSNDNISNSTLIFKLHGSQSAGILDFDNYAGETPKHYVIPVGQYFTGDVLYMTFANDHDVSSPTAESVFTNVKVYEQAGDDNIDFDVHPVESYGGAGQDVNATVAIEDGGSTLRIAGNGWKKIDFPYTITEDTILEFDFQSSTEGEIHGIGFDSNDNISNSTLIFKLHGSQSAGILDFDNYAGETPKHYVIPVGQYFTGDVLYMTFANDHDVSSPTAESVFTNVKVYEQAGDDNIDFDVHPVESYGGAGQDVNATVAIEDGGSTLRIAGNGWKKIDFPYTITEDTILEFDFQSSTEGEIHGIGFDSNDDISNSTLIFKLHGSQSAGILDFDNYAGETPKHYVIPVGQYFTGDVLYMTFANDHDVSSPTAESVFTNVKVYEQAGDDNIDFDVHPVESYGGAGQDVNATVAIEDGGSTLRIAGNGWKKIDFPYTITEDTILEFDFQSSTEGEIHGIGFDSNDDISNSTLIFKLHGSQSAGILDFDNYAGETPKHYVIPVGQYFTGDVLYMTFANDHDVSSPTAESVFTNVKVYEQAGDDNIDFDVHPVESYGGAGQDVNATVAIEDGGSTLRIAGNGWKKIDFPYTITEDTILEFDFQSSTEGEIHGIGFDSNDDISNSTLIFKLHGSQSAGILDFDNYAGETPKHYVIPVGQYFTGDVLYMTFANDHDVSSPTAESVFTNVKVYE